ncbi:DUF4173 domain-containing protein [bacterium]|nr:DUF4173 domain-containing protein [bacterium]
MKFSDYLIYLILVLLFFYLFNGQGLGLNLTVYAFVLVAGLSWIRPGIWNRRLNQVCISGFLLSALNFGVNGGAWTFAVTFAGFLLLISIVVLDKYRSIHSLFIYSFSGFFKGLEFVFSKIRGFRIFPSLPRFRSVLRVTILPLAVVSLFVLLYSTGSVYFNHTLKAIGEFINLHFGNLFNGISLSSVMVFLLGLVLSSVILFRLKLSNRNWDASDNIIRNRKLKRSGFRMMGLKTEYKSGVFLLLTLNLVLAMLLYLEIDRVWINFTYEGQLLKEFVHEGTEVLIFSVVLSMVISLYYFRGNLNFYSASKPLKVLGQIWIALNIVLLISAAVRVGHYIEHFGLAHKRIGLLFFMMCTLIGLLSLYVKLSFRKSFFYLLRVNSMAVLLVVILSTCFNWDRTIATYNVSYDSSAFYHLEYMQCLDGDALPIIYRSEEDWNGLRQNQLNNIELVDEGYYADSRYREYIDSRILNFKIRYRKKSWRSITLSECIAYDELQRL